MNTVHSGATAFRLDDRAFERHVNPWSVWTRFTVLPLLVLAVWSRARLGWWSIAPITLSLLWTWGNPHLFPKPRSTDNWASSGVLGERVWMNRQQVPVPGYHRTLPNVLSAVSVVGVGFIVWGLIVRAPWPTLLGTAVTQLAKLWFIDRMVWLYEDMKGTSPEYRAWLY